MTYKDRIEEQIAKLNKCDFTEIIENSDCKDWKDIFKEFEKLVGETLYLSDDQMLSYLVNRYSGVYDIKIRPYISQYLLVDKIYRE